MVRGMLAAEMSKRGESRKRKSWHNCCRAPLREQMQTLEMTLATPTMKTG